MLIGCTLPAPGVPGPPSPPGGGVNGSCGFCSSAMFFSHLKRRFLRHTASNSSRPRGRAEMFAKCLHLQEVMCQKITENYSTKEVGVARVQPGGLTICELRFLICHFG